MTTTQSLCRRGAVVAAVTLLADQGVKEVARQQLALCTAPPLAACDRLGAVGPLAFVRLENAGSVAGFGQGLWLWLLVAVLGLLLIPIYSRRLRAVGWAAAAVGLQTGGAASNLLDRLSTGGVVDVIDLWPIPLIFNTADVAIVTGALLASVALLRTPAARTRPSQAGA